MSLTERTIRLLNATPGWADLARNHDLDDADLTAILDEAARYANEVLCPLGARSDREGCRLVDGRVITPEGYKETFTQMATDGWWAMDLPEALGGQGLPIATHAASSTFFEGAAIGFMMSVPRPAAHLLNSTAPELASEWVPHLARGDWATTICISEPDAGSDVGRIRTKATKSGDTWRINGAKCWISFGDHDIADRIGHCMLARTETAKAGTRGLSLFLVPDRHLDGSRNGVSVSRIEEKLGIHGSPTCVMAFDDAEGILIGDEGRGIQQMFRMIELMRLQSACQGLGIAGRAVEIATDYAKERRQGGRADAPAVPIIEHADIRRQLTTMEAATEVLRAVVLELSVLLDLSKAGDGATTPQMATQAATQAAILLPLAKNFGGETGFATASAAIQVLGGAGYTQEWPLEQLLRDARVITIYEGTSGMQAQDFLFRRLLWDKGTGMTALIARAKAEIDACPDTDAATHAAAILGRFEDLSVIHLGQTDIHTPSDLAADGYLQAGWVAVSAWMSCRLISLGGEMARFGQFRLHHLQAEMTLAEAKCAIPSELI